MVTTVKTDVGVALLCLGTVTNSTDIIIDDIQMIHNTEIQNTKYKNRNPLNNVGEWRVGSVGLRKVT